MSDDDFMAQSDDEEYDFVRAAGSIFLSRSFQRCLTLISLIYIYKYITLVHCTRACVPLHSCRTTIQTTMAQMLGLQT